MANNILLLAGDGVGPEVMAEVKKIIDWLNKNKKTDIEISEELVGGASYDENKTPLTDEVLYKAMDSDAVLLGAVGGPKYDKLDFAKRPERALLRLRKEMRLFANLRPAICFSELVSTSTLKPEIISDLDIMIVRELTGGVYFGQPRGIKPLENDEREGVNTHRYTSKEIIRVAKVAFDLAKKRKKLVTSVEKSNVMEAGLLWREEVEKLHSDKTYKDIKLNHMLADNCAMQLVRNPKQFDVILTDNLFGDMLSDEAAMTTGSLGMLPSASLSEKDKKGRIRSMYEPCHGSAPDIAGKSTANPIAMILSFSMALKYSLNQDDLSLDVDNAIKKVLSDGLRTPDIMEEGKRKVSTAEMGSAILEKLK
jgi:3-isopropylmalate dehydrogenase